MSKVIGSGLSSSSGDQGTVGYDGEDDSKNQRFIIIDSIKELRENDNYYGVGFTIHIT